MRVWTRTEQVKNKAKFWELITSGSSAASACEALGVHRRTGRRWILETGGRAPVQSPPGCGRYLSLDERIKIADLKMAGWSIRSIATEIERSPSTVSRELRRNAPASNRRYGPHEAQKMAARRACRPKCLKLENQELAEAVRSRLAKNWSPEQISLDLELCYQERPEMQVSHETIYQSLFRQAPSLSGLHRHLRTGRAIRKPSWTCLKTDSADR